MNTRTWLVLWATIAGFLVLSCSKDERQDRLYPPAGERLYVVQSGDESLAEIGLADGRVNTHVLDLGVFSNDIVRFGSRLYVANSGSNNIQEIDANSNRTIRVLPLEGGLNPWTVTLLNADTMAVSCWYSRNIVMLSLRTGTVVGVLETTTGPEGMAVFENRLFVCLSGWEPGGFVPGMVRVYDTHSWALIDSIAVGTNPQHAALDPMDRLHVVCTGDYGSYEGSVHIIDPVSFQVLHVVQTGGSPGAVSFGGGTALLAAGGWSGSPGEVYRYSLVDFTVLNGAANPIETASGATDVEALEDGSFFVSCQEADEVRYHAIDGSPIATYLVSDGPGYMWLYKP